MKEKILNLLIFLLIGFLMFTLSGCSETTHKIYESGFFEYVIVGKTSRFPKNEEDQVVAIVRLTELGQEQEIIDIPRMIDGKEVLFIGYDIIKGLEAFRSYSITSPNLKKMYIHDNIIQIEYDAIDFPGDEWGIMLCSLDFNFNVYYLAMTGKTYIYKFLYDKAVEDLQQSGISDPTYGDRILPANIAFLNNYSEEINGGYYRLDNVQTGEKITQPKNPEREGYEFTGWFTETDCSNIWNFDYEKEIEDGEEFRLYAGWQQK
jgi:uncharacterized repeat protein (TIGR02543 family)